MFPFLKKNKTKELKAFLSGKVLPITESEDEVFSSKSMGDGICIIPTDNTVLAPYNAEVTLVMKDSNHAVALKFENNMEAIIHIGVDTVNLNGDGFECFVNIGDKVKQGEPLISFDAKKIKDAGYSTTSMLVIVKEGSSKNISFKLGFDAKAGEDTIVSYE